MRFCSLSSDGGVCGRAVNTSNSELGGSGFKPRSSHCFLRQGTLLHFVSLHHCVSLPGNRNKLQPFGPLARVRLYLSFYLPCETYAMLSFMLFTICHPDDELKIWPLFSLRSFWRLSVSNFPPMSSSCTVYAKIYPS